MTRSLLLISAVMSSCAAVVVALINGGSGREIISWNVIAWLIGFVYFATIVEFCSAVIAAVSSPPTRASSHSGRACGLACGTSSRHVRRNGPKRHREENAE